MATQTEIANFALSYVGDEPIASFSDANKRARLVTLFFSQARRRALRLHPWNTVSDKASLASDATDPIWGFDLRYKLPSDFERLIDIERSDIGITLEGADRGARYEIENGFIQTDLSSPINIKYVVNESDVTKFDALLTTVVAYSLALDLVEPLTQSNTKKVELESSMKFWLGEARRVSGRERAPQRVRDTSWINSRIRGS